MTGRVKSDDGFGSRLPKRVRRGWSKAQQIAGDAAPLGFERFPTDRLPRATVPVCRILVIAFLAMQVRVHPCSIAAFTFLRPVVRLLPVAPGIPP